MKTYSLGQFTQTKLDDLFGLRQTFQNQRLNDWLKTEITLTSKEKGMLTEFQEILLLNGDGWNEQELSLNFIGPIFALARFTEPYRFNLFAERKIGAKMTNIDGEEIYLSGEPDGLIATGYREPKIPMFAFSEYKRRLDPDGDPAGQTLAAMLIAQALNPQPIPLYGCYVIGRQWNFLILEGKHYTFSHEFLASTKEIYEIFRILKALKLIIMDLTA